MGIPIIEKSAIEVYLHDHVENIKRNEVSAQECLIWFEKLMVEQPALAELISTLIVLLEHKEDGKLEKGDVTYYLMLGTKIAYEAIKKQMEINELEATV